MGHRVGVDVGGTFTDLVGIQDGELHVEKVPSTPDEPDRAVGDAIDAFATAVDPERIDALVHGTTVATNAILEGEWPTTAFVTTAGFRDVLEIGRQNRPDIYDLQAEKPRPIVSREHRYGVPERLDERGEVLEPVDADAVREIGETIAESDAGAVAVSLLFAYENDAHERRVATLLEEAGVSTPISLSSEVLPEIREYERSVATATNSALTPVMERYLGRLETRLDDRHVPVLPTVMSSSGGVMTAQDAQTRPIRTLLSGPAAGVAGAAHVASVAGFEDALTMDMGGTSCDVALVEDGEPTVGHETRVGDYPIDVPAVDIETVGAGGGSIASVDSGGALRVGPASAGADPGPICYGRGGRRPTTTDAHVVLDRIDPSRLVDSPADRERVHAGMATLADALDRSIDATAAGILRVANANMERALRVVSVERGRDPRDLPLVAFGGAGPLHAPRLAADLGIPRVLVPPAAGVLSAVGLLTSDVLYDASRTRIRRWAELDPAQLAAEYDRLEDQGTDRLAAASVPVEGRTLERSAALRYVGQSFTVPVAVPDSLDASAMAAVADRFHGAHEREYGSAAPDEPIELETLRVRARGHVEAPTLAPPTPESGPSAPRTRSVGFAGERHETRILERARLSSGATIDGPAIVAGAASTIAVPPGQEANIDERGTIIVEVEP